MWVVLLLFGTLAGCDGGGEVVHIHEVVDPQGHALQLHISTNDLAEPATQRAVQEFCAKHGFSPHELCVSRVTSSLKEILPRLRREHISNLQTHLQATDRGEVMVAVEEGVVAAVAAAKKVKEEGAVASSLCTPVTPWFCRPDEAYMVNDTGAALGGCLICLFGSKVMAAV